MIKEELLCFMEETKRPKRGENDKINKRSSDVPGGSSQGKAVCSEARVGRSFRPQLPERNREMATQTRA
ncbi:hypothetical protein Q8A67_022021 [Cirrhinus molitorella]|uniref:Uncharacterized protein n=1 Tax=Cirrhinus molitorella TaxID=172907 RepID=A0AA88P837_9TELE|nr:hypothetical protein Q8A67_022021 [Cirrhinus molitorella]